MSQELAGSTFSSFSAPQYAPKMAQDRHGGPPRGGLYFTCLARGPNLFGPNSEEMGILREELGDVPRVGFFCNGEVSHDRIYGYTGVLALFL